MFAVYASEGNIENPLASLAVGERPEPVVPEGWVRVKVSHASLNRHDIFTLMGVTAQADPIVFPMILGNDGAGTLDDGSEVIIYPLMGAPDWRGDETLDPDWNIFSERVPGTFADYVAVPRRNAIPRPSGISAKPWFDGKVKFSPPVYDFAERGFRLTGGRLDYLNGWEVAALVYQRKLHVINLFIWPWESGRNTGAESFTKDGYNVSHWDRDGFEFWAVSDVNAEDLRAFAGLEMQQS